MTQKRLSKYSRHRILMMFNSGSTILAIAAATGIREEKINQVISGKYTPVKKQSNGPANK